MDKKCWLIFPLLFLSSCVSMKDAGRAYFKKGSEYKGVEPAEVVVARLQKDARLRQVLYGQVKPIKIMQCTILRNQFYVAAMAKVDDQEIYAAAKTLENAYQQDDQEFLRACDQVMSGQLGKSFVAIQQEYLNQNKKP